MKKIIVSVLSGLVLSTSLSVTEVSANSSEAARQVPPQFMMRYRQAITEKTEVMKLSEADQAKLMEMKVGLYHQQQAANKEFSNDKQARDAARKANRRAYNAEFNKMTTKQQRDDLQKWRRQQRQKKA